MSLDVTTPVEKQSHPKFSLGGTTVIQGKGKGSFNGDDGSEEKERQLKEVRAQLEFEDVSVEDMDEDDAEVKVKQDKETSQPKVQGGRKENQEDGVKSKIAKKLEFEDDYSKPYRSSTTQTAFLDSSSISVEPVKRTGGKQMGETPLPASFHAEEWYPSARVWRSSKHVTELEAKLPPLMKTPSEILATEMSRKLAHLLIELQKTPHASEKRKEILMLHQLRPTVDLKRPHDTDGVKRNSDHLEPWMEQGISFLPIQGGNFASNPLTVSAIIVGHSVHRVYDDCGVQMNDIKD
ncbi:hypothetical protein E3N88_04145 [Mikania micrantha]|uniref:Uncharacterized protein n=1 Tax=Mikania micrantha TaxID=192012 RepID=A0A5N6PUV0_9ASTR|nr:hypothetical protein E3N88_04145 [Mikania micrantha]